MQSISNLNVKDFHYKCEYFILDTPTENYREVLDINVLAPAICAREFAQSIKKRNAAGHIINIGR